MKITGNITVKGVVLSFGGDLVNTTSVDTMSVDYDMEFVPAELETMCKSTENIIKDVTSSVLAYKSTNKAARMAMKKANRMPGRFGIGMPVSSDMVKDILDDLFEGRKRSMDDGHSCTCECDMCETRRRANDDGVENPTSPDSTTKE